VISGICGEYGKKFTWEIKAKQMGQTETKAASIIIGYCQTTRFSCFDYFIILSSSS
jgi:hypothetical protein